MAVAKKGRRKIHVDGTDYYWLVREEIDHFDVGASHVLIVVSNDKKFLVHYPLNQNGEHNFLVVLGPRFEGTGNFGGSWKRVECPKWEDGETIKPGGIRELILWSLSPKPTRNISYLGKRDISGVAN